MIDGKMSRRLEGSGFMLEKELEDEMDEIDVLGWNNSFSNDDEKDYAMAKKFTVFLLRFGETLERDTLEAALEDSELLNTAERFEYVHKIIIMYPALFEKFWDVFWRD